MSDRFMTKDRTDCRPRSVDILPKSWKGSHQGGRSIPFFLSLGFLVIFLASCGNPPSNSNNINFPYGIAVCSSTCNTNNALPLTTTSFAAVTSYGTHQILIFTNYAPPNPPPTSPTTPNDWFSSNNSLSPTASLYNSLQGPDGVLISSQSFTTSNGYLCKAPVLYGADGIGNIIGIWCGFDPNNTSNPGPTITISSGSLQSPEGMALDWVNSPGTTPSDLSAPILFVANPGSSNILAFDLSQITGPGTANLSPSGGLLPGTNGGLPFGQPANNTELNGPAFVAFSNSKNTLFVSDTGNSQVNLYGNGHCIGVNQESTRPQDCSNNQNVPPTVWFSGSNTYLSSPSGIAYYQGGLYVVDPAAGSVLIWDNVMNITSPGGNVGPTRRINGSNTNQNYPYALAIDGNTTVPPGNTFFVSQLGSGRILGYNNATTISGNIAPTYTIGVTNPSLSSGNTSGGGTTGYPGFP